LQRKARYYVNSQIRERLQMFDNLAMTSLD